MEPAASEPTSSKLPMNSETALRLVKNGGTILMLDVPRFTLIGIDTQVFSAGPNFKGIKMIPPGPHFVYYSSSNKDGSEYAPIIGFFVYISPSEVIVRKWIQQEERLVMLSEDEEECYSMAVKNLEFDHQLGPYGLIQFWDWIHISNYVTKDVIKRIEPIGGEITVTNEAELAETVPKTAMEKQLAEQLKNKRLLDTTKRACSPRCYYTTIPHVFKVKGVPKEELTSLNLDKTHQLESILMQNFAGEEDLLLGELQFCFIAFLMGQSLGAFFQWKAILSLLLGCQEAFIKVIYFQLNHGLQQTHGNTSNRDKGVFIFMEDSWLNGDNFLHHLCKEFFSLTQEATTIDGNLLLWVKKLKELLETSLGWNFDRSPEDGIFGEDDEFAPVVVMPEETRGCEEMAS
ncbi:protein AAR2 homolog isoform X5 [Amborella trichopoda]|uniref:protein AAR2 homolog isoform X5 n=1 Tax=Amborella trichopoda TaxID=13333 RepID=UPI0009BF0135|nr:protein AAR2 homolog isoform X5 [Amborella trichopoda]|eukprot:XP_020523331.1 protein AAR2 homolog isoform X5 [Amborella trichopoda]